MQRTFFCRILIVWGICAAIGLTTSNLAIAQQPKNEFGSGQRSRRNVSPFLSTLDNGSGENALNYFNIVKPQTQGAQTAKRLQSDLNKVQTSLSQPRGSEEPSELAPITSGRLAPTGHGATFNDLQNRFGGGGGSTGHAPPYGFGGDGRGYTNVGSSQQKRGGYGKGLLGGARLFGAAFGRQ
jgi:hypothetical protein